VGNAWRRDDGVGLVVARRLRGTLPAGVDVLELEGEPTSLIEAWEGADRVWIVDAVASGSEAGTLHRVDATDVALPAELFRTSTSTHHVGLAETVELARALGRLPERIVVYGIEGARFDVGDELTPAVDVAARQAADALREEVAACTSER